MPGTKALRFWLILGIVFLWVSLMSQLCHEFLLARVRSPADVLHPMQRTYSLHAGLTMAVTGLVALCATRLAYGVRRPAYAPGQRPGGQRLAEGPPMQRLLTILRLLLWLTMVVGFALSRPLDALNHTLTTTSSQSRP